MTDEEYTEYLKQDIYNQENDADFDPDSALELLIEQLAEETNYKD